MNGLHHLAVIMDGNGRWAERRGLPRWRGHERGLGAVRRLCEAACRLQIPCVSLFAFSSENWKRPETEVRFLFRLFRRYLGAEREYLLARGIRVSAFGRRDRLPRPVLEELERTEAETRECGRLHLRIALDYGARYEIASAARELAGAAARGELDPGEITEERVSRELGRDAAPDPDLVIRTAGERRLSNFLLWQAAYSELYFSPTLWPDFGDSDLDAALADYGRRTRKFGALPLREAR